MISLLRSKAALTAAIHHGGRTMLVVNTRSRKGRRHYPGLPARLAAAGVPVQATFPVDARPACTTPLPRCSRWTRTCWSSAAATAA